MKLFNKHITIVRFIYEVLDKFIELLMTLFAYTTLPIIKINKDKPDKKKVLLVCHRAYMAEFFAIIPEILKNESRVAIYLLDYRLYDIPQSRQLIKQALPFRFVSRFRAYLTKWDLIVSAGTVQKHLVTNKRAPTLYIEHGMTANGSIRQKKLSVFGPDIYENGKNGKIRFSTMFVSSIHSKKRAVMIDKQLESIVSVVGFYPIDKLIALLPQRVRIRQSLGIAEHDKVIMTLSTWGENCLFNFMGDDLIAQAKTCFDRYKFILNIHPLECRKKPKGVRVWGDYFLTLKKNGFIVRTAMESWMPYLIASDAVITDYTSLALFVPSLNIPIILTPYDDRFVAEDGLARKLKEFCPVLERDAKNLKQVLDNVFKNYPYDKLREVSALVTSYPGASFERQKEEIYDMLKLTS